MESQKHSSEPPYDELDDDQVIALVQKNSDVFEVLYERYFQRVYHYCLKRTSDVQIAEDLCSDIFIKVMSNLASYTGGNFAGWLFRIAHNSVIDHYRRHKKVIALDSDLIRGDTQMTERIANQMAVEELLSELSESERELLSLRLDVELTAPEIAELTGKSANAVRVQVYRILQRLRDRYTAVMGDHS
ncbi:MAG: RNA polymerase sigma factor [Anaerolineae bacterium]